MAGKVMGWVFKLNVELRPEDLLVLLAYADHAHADGTHIFPGVKLIAKKTRRSVRSVQYSTRRLVGLGLLVPDGKGRHGTNMWHIPVPWGDDGDTGDIPDGATDFTTTRAQMVQPVASMEQAGMVQPGTQMVQPVSLNGAIAVAPKPSLTVKESIALVKRPAIERPVIPEEGDVEEHGPSGSTSALATEGSPSDPATLATLLIMENDYLVKSNKFLPGKGEFRIARNEDLQLALERGVEAYQKVQQVYGNAHSKIPDRAALRVSLEQQFPSKDPPE